MFSELGGGGEELSNGTGPLFMGTAASGNIRRALLQFDLGSLPAGSRFNAAWLQVYIDASLTPSGTLQRNTFVNRVTSAWGEGASFSSTGSAIAQNNDATWQSRIYPSQSWIVDGGDFSTTLSSSYGIDSLTGKRGFFGPQMVNDVHNWLATPATNLGWLLRSDEGTNSTTKTLASRENADTAKRPTLTLVHATPYEKWLSQYFPAYLTGQWLDPRGDLDGDRVINQLEYAYGYHPLVAEAQDGVSSAFTPGSGGDRVITSTFLRDTAATDLTYQLQVSADLVTWITIAQSASGAVATGQNGGTVTGETNMGGTIKQVSATKTLTGSDAARHFVRLLVERVP